MSNIVCIGAGQTGRGYINRFFSNEKITFVDKDLDLIKQLQLNKSYKIKFGAERKSISLSNYEAYAIDSQEALEKIQNADLIMISVGQKNLIDLVPILKPALKDRKKGDIDIITCENGVNAKKALIPLCEDNRVHLAEAIVFCTTLKQEESLDILSENLDYLPYDVVSLGHTLPYDNMIPEKNLNVLMQRKIYTYNCISAVVSYLGFYKGYEIYSEAANDDEINGCIQKILKVLNKCICKEYGTPEEEQLRFSKMAIQKFQNKEIIDTIDRNARDVERKLGEKERIIAPLSIIEKYNEESYELLLVIAAALYYGQKTDTLTKKPEQYIQLLKEDWKSKVDKYLSELYQNKKISDIV